MPTDVALGVTAALKVTNLRESLSRVIDLNQGVKYRNEALRINRVFEDAEELLERPVEVKNYNSEHVKQALGVDGDMTFVMVEAATSDVVKNKAVQCDSLGTFAGTLPLKKSSEVEQYAKRNVGLRAASDARAAEVAKKLSKTRAQIVDADKMLADRQAEGNKTGSVDASSERLSLTQSDKVHTGRSNEDVVMYNTPAGSALEERSTRGANAITPGRLTGSGTSKIAKAALAQDTTRSPPVQKKETKRSTKKTSTMPPPCIPRSLATPSLGNGTSQQALALGITVSQQTFTPFGKRQGAGDLKFEVFHNGTFAGIAFISARFSASLNVNGGSQIFSGTRFHRQSEKPWVYKPDSKEPDEQYKGSGKWELVADALKREVIARGQDSNGDTSCSAKYLAALADLPLPSHLKDADQQLGIIDVVITIGSGRKYGPDTAYLTKPQHMNNKRYKPSDVIFPSATKRDLSSNTETFADVDAGDQGMPTKSPDAPPPKWSLGREEPGSPTPASRDPFAYPGKSGNKVEGIPWGLPEALLKVKVDFKTKKGVINERTLRQALGHIGMMREDRQMEAWMDLKSHMKPDVLEAIEKVGLNFKGKMSYSANRRAEKTLALHVKAVEKSTAPVPTPAVTPFIHGSDKPSTLSPPQRAPGAAMYDHTESAQDMLECLKLVAFGTTTIARTPPKDSTEEQAIAPQQTINSQQVTINPHLDSQVVGPEAYGPSALLRYEDWYPYQVECAARGKFALDGYENDPLGRMRNIAAVNGIFGSEMYMQTWSAWHYKNTLKDVEDGVYPDPWQDGSAARTLAGPNPKKFLWYKMSHTSQQLDTYAHEEVTNEDRIMTALSYGADPEGPLIAYIKKTQPIETPSTTDIRTVGQAMFKENRHLKAKGKKHGPTSPPKGPRETDPHAPVTVLPFWKTAEVSALANSPMKVSVKRKARTSTVPAPDSDTLESATKRQRLRNGLDETPATAATPSTTPRRGAAEPATPSKRTFDVSPSKSGLGSSRKKQRGNPDEPTYAEAAEQFVVPDESVGSVLGYADEGIRQISKGRNGEFKEDKVVVGMRFVLI